MPDCGSARPGARDYSPPTAAASTATRGQAEPSEPFGERKQSLSMPAMLPQSLWSAGPAPPRAMNSSLVPQAGQGEAPAGIRSAAARSLPGRRRQSSRTAAVRGTRRSPPPPSPPDHDATMRAGEISQARDGGPHAPVGLQSPRARSGADTQDGDGDLQHHGDDDVGAQPANPIGFLCLSAASSDADRVEHDPELRIVPLLELRELRRQLGSHLSPRASWQNAGATSPISRPSCRSRPKNPRWRGPDGSVARKAADGDPRRDARFSGGGFP